MLSFLRKQESVRQVFLDSRFRGSDSDLGFFSNLPNHFAFGEPVFIRPAELGGIQQVFL